MAVSKTFLKRERENEFTFQEMLNKALFKHTQEMTRKKMKRTSFYFVESTVNSLITINPELRSL